MKLFFGGTFDPIHNGHIQLALHINQQFKQKVSLLPLGGIPNYKTAPQASLSQRLAMLELVAGQYPEQIEIDYSESRQTSYTPTYLSLQRLAQIYGAEPLYFILGSDSLINLASWDNWRELFELCNFIVALRPDHLLDNMSAELSAEVLPRLSGSIRKEQTSGQIILTHFKPIAVSSTGIRQNCAKQIAINDLVTLDVANYIHTHNLYKENQC